MHRFMWPSHYSPLLRLLDYSSLFRTYAIRLGVSIDRKMEKRPADGLIDGNTPVSKKGRWDSGPVMAAPVQDPAAAAALAAAVAAKYVKATPGRPLGAPPVVSLPSNAGGPLSTGAAAAVAQAAAAALQKLPLTANALNPGATIMLSSAALSAVPTGAAPTPGARPPSISLDALEKAKKALQLQKEIQEKLKSKLPQLAAKLPVPGGALPASTTSSDTATVAHTPASVPASALAPGPGAVVIRPGALPAPPMVPPGASLGVRPPPGAIRPPLPSFLAGAATPAMVGGLSSMLPPTREVAAAPEDERFHDPVLDRGAAARKGERRRRAGFDFVAEGRFQREAELFRLKSQLGAGAFRKGAPRVSGPLGDPNRIPLGGAAAALASIDANSVPLGTREKAASREATPAPEAEPVPAVEWWDRGLLAHASLDHDVPELPAEVVESLSYTSASGAGGMDAEMADANGEGMGGADGRGREEDEGMADREEGAEAAARARTAAAGRVAAAVEAAAQAAAAGQMGPFQLKESRITIYIEHPVPLEPPAEAAPPPPQPLKLTAKELKKLRTQRRIARDKEKQELIRQGLLEPPKPKVRIANLHRVLGTDSALDPTAVEKEVRKQMAERQAAHDDRNLARKLTPAERRDKKLRKLFGAAAVETGVAEVGARGGARGAAAAAATAAGAAAGVDVICSVYRVGRLTDPQHRFKVDANARENHMTGMVVISDEFCVVVVEGVEKATRRYAKLMMRRIDWSTAPPPGRPAGRDLPMLSDDEAEDDEERLPNVCTLVWQGTVLRRSFTGLRTETVRSAAAGRQLLADMGVGHYWDAAASAVEGESVPYTV